MQQVSARDLGIAAQALLKAQECFPCWPKQACWTEIESWFERPNYVIEFTIRRLPTSD
ncbi:hypothetical protein [Aminobacter carboxidus]|uniref:hypothetical protein n=1 Tax=Aminobacter carboxidus TaxID=376165 RepID=UPI003EBF1929